MSPKADSTEKKPVAADIPERSQPVDVGDIYHLPIETGDGSLMPAPTKDPFDPLNWSKLRKYNIIGIVCLFYFLLTYLTTAPVPSFSLLEKQFDASYNQVNWSFGISAFGLAFGPLVTSSLAETYGRRVVTIVSTAIAVLASGCTSIKGQSIGQYMAARFFQGFAAGPAANVGLSIINDISWEHERGYRIGLWAMSANIGSVLGGLSKLASLPSEKEKNEGLIIPDSWRIHSHREPILGGISRHHSLRISLALGTSVSARNPVSSRPCCCSRTATGCGRGAWGNLAEYCCGHQKNHAAPLACETCPRKALVP